MSDLKSQVHPFLERYQYLFFLHERLAELLEPNDPAHIDEQPLEPCALQYLIVNLIEEDHPTEIVFLCPYKLLFVIIVKYIVIK